MSSAKAGKRNHIDIQRSPLELHTYPVALKLHARLMFNGCNLCFFCYVELLRRFLGRPTGHPSSRASGLTRVNTSTFLVPSWLVVVSGSITCNSLHLFPGRSLPRQVSGPCRFDDMPELLDTNDGGSSRSWAAFATRPST